MTNQPLLLRELGTTDYQIMMNSSKMLKKISTWLMQHDVLKQYSIAKALLYGQ